MRGIGHAHMLTRDDFLGIFKTFNKEKIYNFEDYEGSFGSMQYAKALAVCRSFLDGVVIIITIILPDLQNLLAWGGGDGKGGGIKCKIRLPRASFLLAGSLLPTSWVLGRACSLHSLNIPSLVGGWVGGEKMEFRLSTGILVLNQVSVVP